MKQDDQSDTTQIGCDHVFLTFELTEAHGKLVLCRIAAIDAIAALISDLGIVTSTQHR